MLYLAAVLCLFPLVCRFQLQRDLAVTRARRFPARAAAELLVAGIAAPLAAAVGLSVRLLAGLGFEGPRRAVLQLF